MRKRFDFHVQWQITLKVCVGKLGYLAHLLMIQSIAIKIIYSTGAKVKSFGVHVKDYVFFIMLIIHSLILFYFFLCIICEALPLKG